MADMRKWFGRVAVLAVVLFFFLSTVVLAAGRGHVPAPPQVCCQLIGRGAIALKNLLLASRHVVHRSPCRAAHVCADPARGASGESPWGRYAAGVD